ncbi:hypothetical protein ACP70R_041204 [Stipagrostis hirtigluma subsp. patula]
MANDEHVNDENPRSHYVRHNSDMNKEEMFSMFLFHDFQTVVLDDLETRKVAIEGSRMRLQAQASLVKPS